MKKKSKRSAHPTQHAKQRSVPTLQDSLLNARIACNEILNLGLDGLQKLSSLECARIQVAAAHGAVNEVRVRVAALNAVSKAKVVGTMDDASRLLGEEITIPRIA